jgi:septum site-determining protein MinC
VRTELASRDHVIIKGTKHGLAVLLDEKVAYQKVLAEFIDRIRQAETFFRGARVTVDVGHRDLGPEQIDELAETLARYDITLQGVVATTDGETVLSDLAQQSSDEARFSSPTSLERPLLDSRLGDALLIRRVVKAGETIRYHGHICVVGDVEPRALLEAGGDVIVWGKLQGAVRAGATDNPEAVVCALLLAPSHLAIADLVGHVPPPMNMGEMPPEVALVRDGRIVVEPWGRAAV